MAIEVKCPACSKVFRVVDSAAGKKGACPYCSAFIVVSQPRPVQQEAPQEPAWDPRNTFPVFAGHTGGVTGVTFSAGGSIALSAGEDGTVRLWDVQTGLETLRLSGHDGAVSSAALTRDGAFILSGGADKTVRLWRVSNGMPQRAFEGHTDAVTSVAFYPLGGYVLSSSLDGTVRIWEMASGKCARICKGHKGAVTSISVHPEGKSALSSGADGTLRLWRCDKGKEIGKFTGHRGPVYCGIFNSDGAFVFSGGEDRNAVIWKAETQKPLVVLKGHTAAVRALALSRDNATAVTGGTDWTVRTWNVDKAQVTHTFEVDESAITGVALDARGSHILSGNSKGILRLWDIGSARLTRTFGGTEHSVNTRCPSCAKVFAILAKLVDLDGVCPFCKAAFKANPYSPARSREAMKRGLAEMAAGKLDKAQAGFDEAIRLQGDNHEAILNMIVCHNRVGTNLNEMGRYAEALAALDDAVKLYSSVKNWAIEYHLQALQEGYAAAFLAGKICRYHLADAGRAIEYLRFARSLNNTQDVEDMLAHVNRGPTPEGA